MALVLLFGTRKQSGRLRFIATIEDPPVVERILRHLGLPTAIPVPAPARPPPTRSDAFDFPS